jgi:SHS2 domain-containing protein
VLDHTADYMVEVSAETLPALFAEAARALFDVITDLETVDAREPVAVGVEAESIEELLVSWLTELLFLYEDGRWLFSRFEPRILNERRIEAEAWGERLDPKRHPIDREVKAVTYHRMAVKREGNLVTTTIVFDL